MNGNNGSPPKVPAPVFESKSTKLPLTNNLMTAFSSISPSSFTDKDKTNDASQNSGYKFAPIFTFRDHKSDDDKKSETAFTFTLGKPNADFISNNLNKETLKIKDIENKKDLGQSDELKIDRNSENNTDNSNNEINEEDFNQQKQQNEELNSNKEFNMKMLFNEFKELIKDILKERVESEKKITALEKRVEVLENERRLLQEVTKERHLFNITDNISTTSTNNRAETALLSQSIDPSGDSTANFGNFQSRADVITSLPVNYECAPARFANKFLQSSVNASFNRNDYDNPLLPLPRPFPMQPGMYYCQANPTMNSMNIQETETGLQAHSRRKLYSELGTLHKERVLYEPFIKNDYGNVEDKTIKMPNHLDSNQRKENIDNRRFNTLQSLVEQSIQNALKDTLNLDKL